jgi:glycosyltransferase involved in cell wall biosynthesis
MSVVEPMGSAPAGPRVLVAHNRYRIVGGEERSVELQLAALRGAGIPTATFERSSAEAGRLQAARALVTGGERPEDLADAVREHSASFVHVHNQLPLIGPRGLAAASGAGARVMLHLENVRIFCASGFGERDGSPCTRCRGRNTIPGLVLNCRRSLAEAVPYAIALSLHQPKLLDAVSSFVVPSNAQGHQLMIRGLPPEKIVLLPHYMPAAAFAERSRVREGAYALVASRLSPEKGIDEAIAACALAGAPLRVAGEGPDRPRLEELARTSGADVTFLGRISSEEVREQLEGAAMILMSSHYHEASPFSALESMAQGVPLVANAMGGLPELLGEGRCVELGDVEAFAGRLRALWVDPGFREAEGEALLARAREHHSEERYVQNLLALYAAAQS